MIGTHDSFTYLKAKNKIYELFSFTWRTQTKSLKEQKEFGVKYLDIRIHKTKENQWELCHGLVNFCKYYNTLSELMEDLSDFKVRLILEKALKMMKKYLSLLFIKFLISILIQFFQLLKRIGEFYIIKT